MLRVLIYGMTANRGGMESFVMNYYTHFDREKVHFDFVSEDQPIAAQEELEAMGSTVYHIPARRENLLGHMRALRRIVKEGNYSVVYYHLLSASAMFSVWAAKGLRGVKTVVHSHNNSVGNERVHRLLRPFLNAAIDKRLACSSMAASFMFGDRKAQQTRVINNAIDIDRYRYVPEERQVARAALGLEDAFVVGHIGRLCYQKNTLFLLDIFRAVLDRMPQARLLLVGEGEDRAQVEQKIRQLGLEDAVVLTGMRSDIPQLLLAMDMFLLPSRFEGLSVVLIEAQAAGLNSVVSRGIMPDSCDVSGRVQFVDLADGPEVWAEAVCDCAGKARYDCTVAIQKAGFDIAQEASMLQNYLCELSDA